MSSPSVFFGVIPRLLAFVNDYAVFRLHLSEVIKQARRQRFYRVDCVLRILPPGEEEKLPVQRR
jgi:hypothetical protein